jgi:hypothetical protein
MFSGYEKRGPNREQAGSNEKGVRTQIVLGGEERARYWGKRAEDSGQFERRVRGPERLGLHRVVEGDSVAKGGKTSKL